MTSFVSILRTYQSYGLAAFVLTVFATPIAIRLASRFGIMDFPDKLLKPHARPIPYLGGAAICLGWTAALGLALARGAVAYPLLLPILLGGVAISVIGLIDDVRQITPRLRLTLEAGVVIAVIVATRAGTHLVDAVLGPVGIHLPYWLAAPASGVLSVVIVLGAVNSTNLIDGLDGLCTGVTAIISLAFFLLAAHLAVWGFSSNGDPVRLVLSIAMLGAALGFLPFNFNPARIFMGDAGSTLLGYNCGMLILLFGEKTIFRWPLGALMIFALPVFDTTLAMFRRWRSGRSIFEGDRSHFYDQLVQRGLSVRRTVMISYGLAIVCAATGLLLTWVSDAKPVIRTRHAIPLYAVFCIIIALVAWRTGLMSPDERRAGKRPPAEQASEERRHGAGEAVKREQSTQ